MTSASVSRTESERSDDLARRLTLGGCIGQREERSRVSHRQRTGREVAADFVRQAQQTQVIRDRRSILANRRRNLVLRETELVNETLICKRLVDRDSDLPAGDFRRARARASAARQPAGRSRTTTGTLSSPARCAARHRRSPAMIRYVLPVRRTRIGWMMPLARIEAASSSSLASSHEDPRLADRSGPADRRRPPWRRCVVLPARQG